MKSTTATKKYLTVFNKAVLLGKKIKRLQSSILLDKNKRSKLEKFEAQMFVFDDKLHELSNFINYDDFAKFIESTLCCTWEDFKNLN